MDGPRSDSKGMVDLRRIAKKMVTPFRQYLGRLTVADRYLRGEGLEIGALQDPMPLKNGARARYVDIASTEELRKMYPAKTRRYMVDVDIVDDGEKLGKVADASQDFVASNHFFEHCEDPIGTLFNMLRVVRGGGIVYLSIPDKRKIFDEGRQATTVEHVVRDYEKGPEISRREHYREVAEIAAGAGGATAVATKLAELEEKEFRIHFHCWSQTDFLELLCSLQRREGFPAFDIVEFVANQREMIVVLKKHA